MNFLELQLGGPGVTFPDTPRSRLPFSFAAPVSGAYAVLQSFHLQVDDSDAHVENVQVSLTTHFDPVQSDTSGQVEIEIQRTGGDGNPLTFETDVIEAEVRILVIGI